MDIKAVYLYAELKEDIFMKIPEGDLNFGKGYFKLQKALFGLKQAAREWNNNISTTLKQFGSVAQHYKEPKVKEWKKVIQIFRYLKGTKYYDILFNGEKCLKTYVDLDYTNDKETRRSTTGFIYFMGSGPTSWYSKLQKCVATSIAEAEYYGLCECAKQALWYRNILGEIKDQRECIKIYIDNQAAVFPIIISFQSVVCFIYSFMANLMSLIN